MPRERERERNRAIIGNFAIFDIDQCETGGIRVARERSDI